MNKSIAAALIVTVAAVGITACNSDKGKSTPVAAEAVVAEVTTTRPAPTTQAYTGAVTDVAYAAVLREEGISVSSTAAAANFGKLVCRELDSGTSLLAVVIAGVPTFTFEEASFATGAAVGAYCPKYAYLIDQYTK